ncbi:glycoside hydrolase family 16 protein [Jaapia argillacea MUCL 33604]|uniref:Glycoside hydrolase family 16 protein n=1 Tax=Jaapia argillacea MUCL 33604 TaxID=933084 RepID=A0A067PQR7_9AGAM|nr:glycoside hydrolase family 16 protein [Jaapia argillacea MUCL 33604]
MLTQLFLLAATVPVVLGATYSLTDNYVGPSFLTGFTHEAIADPTHGRVNYTDQATALAKNLTYTSSDTLIMRADYTTTLSASGPGRNSVRIKSVKTYTTHTVVFDIRHMPQGCATWPAAWETLESDWPASGEVDIVEGVNDVSPNQSTLHTSPNCTMPDGRTQTGTVAAENCDTTVNGNAGCGVKAPTTNSYGPTFNANGGGWYAMERTTTYIKVWFWPRNSASVPSDVKTSGSASVNTGNWGTPTAYFPNTDCNLASHFGANNIIINLTLCGDWAGAVFNSDGCSGDCVTYVNDNPSAFANAYWNIAAVRVYQ